MTQPAAKVVKRGRGHPPHEPTQQSRMTVEIMVAGGIIYDDIAAYIGISLPTLRKHYAHELAVGKTKIDTIVVGEHLKRIKAGDFPAIKWWEQSRMNWRGDVDDPGRAAEANMRVSIELVGEPAPPTIEHEPQRSDDRGRDDNPIRKHVQLIG
jgi:hypothetical protein